MAATVKLSAMWLLPVPGGPSSSGRVEGLITKIKLVKRQMFGRGSLDLLKHRVMAAT
jgi:transposase